MNVSSYDLVPLISVGLLCLGSFALLLVEVFAEQEADRRYAAYFAAGILGLAAWVNLATLNTGGLALFVGEHGPSLYQDDFARASSFLLMGGALLTALISPVYARNARMDGGEYYALLLMAVVGMQVMVMAADLITLFLGLETMSIAVYALTGLRANDARASEAALKYFLIGAFASGFLVFGIALIYGATGRVGYVALRGGTDEVELFNMGLAMVAVGFGFKVAAVPFHMWAPDVYEGAPTPVTGFMAVAVKAAAFLGLLRVVAMGGNGATWVTLLSALAVATIVVGNALALVQDNVKRMLAYSSVSHAGYLLIGIVAAARGETTAFDAVLFYLSAYTFTTLGAFGVLTFLERAEGGNEAERFSAYAGIGFKYPALGVAMTLFMVALAGMPPTGGFFGKLYLFSAAIRAGDVGLALVGIFGSIVSVYYYLRVTVSLYMLDRPEPGPRPAAHPSPSLSTGIAAAAVLTLLLGIFPSVWLDVTHDAGAALEEVPSTEARP